MERVLSPHGRQIPGTYEIFTDGPMNLEKYVIGAACKQREKH